MNRALPTSQVGKLRRPGNSEARKEIEYWKLRDEELFRALNTSASGLDAIEAARRLGEYGSNEIPSAGRRTAVVISCLSSRTR